MINSFQLFFENRFYDGNILECDRTLFEVAFESIIFSTRLLMLSSVYSGRLREAASTASAIIRIAVSRVNGFGPG
mgnify:CR=1 FL=1